MTGKTVAVVGSRIARELGQVGKNRPPVQETEIKTPYTGVHGIGGEPVADSALRLSGMPAG